MNAPKNLVDAVSSGDAYEVERLLELTTDPDMASAYTEDGWSLLHLAPNRQVAELLISHGADINARNRHKVFGPGNRPLHAAVYMDRLDVVQALIHAGAEVSSTDDAGWTPLHLAVANGRVEIARMLLVAHADPNARIHPVEGRTWSHCSPLDLLEVQDQTGEGAPPLPEDVQHELWELLRRYGARAPGAVVGSAPEHSPEQDQTT
jgi:ankyrin repeat protein